MMLILGEFTKLDRLLFIIQSVKKRLLAGNLFFYLCYNRND